MTTSVLPGNTASNPGEANWKDSNRYRWLLSAALPLLPIPFWALADAFGLSPLWWIGPIAVWVVIPVVDVVLGKDGNNPPDWAVPQLENDHWYRQVTYLYLPGQFASLLYAMYLLTQRPDLSWVDRIGITITIGMITGISVAAAHELGHKKEHIERWLAKFALAPSCYGHFFIEHNRGHHVRVATPEDPASSRLGENLWMFLPRTSVGGIRSAFELERTRLQRLGKRSFSPRNDVWNAYALSLVLIAVLVALFGPMVLPYFLAQAAFGALVMFEAVNYLEHYGLARQKLPSGRYERVSPQHSWNSNNKVTNIFLFHLQRHSDHHANPTRRYQALRALDGAPELPCGYAGMLLLAYVPPLWRRVMDPRVLAHYDGDISRAHIDPRCREKVLARYAG